MRSAHAFVVLMVAACGGGSGMCDLGRLVEQLGEPDDLDCGELAIGDQSATFQAAHDCLAGAIANGTSARVTWDVLGIDSEIRRAFVLAGQTSYFLRYDGDPTGGSGGGAFADTLECASVDAIAPCSDQELRTSLCFACTGSVVVDDCQE